MKIPDLGRESRVQVILGMDSPALHMFPEIRQDGNCSLWAGKTPLGWILHGRDLTGTEESCFKVNLLLDSEAGTALNSVCSCQFDYVDRSCDPHILLPSLDNRRAEKIMKKSCILVDGHFQIGISWKKNCLDLLNNYNMAFSRLRSLGKRLVAAELFDRYKGKTRDMISQDNAI